MSAQWAARRLEENPFDKAGKRKPTVSVIQKGGAQCKEMACRIAVNLRFFPCSGSICTVEEDFELNPMEGEAIVISPDSSDARLFDVRCPRGGGLHIRHARYRRNPASRNASQNLGTLSLAGRRKAKFYGARKVGTDRAFCSLSSVPAGLPTRTSAL